MAFVASLAGRQVAPTMPLAASRGRVPGFFLKQIGAQMPSDLDVHVILDDYAAHNRAGAVMPARALLPNRTAQLMLRTFDTVARIHNVNHRRVEANRIMTRNF